MRRIRLPYIFASLVLLVPCVPKRSDAAWPTDPTVNVPLCVATGEQRSPALATDGAGGVIAAWTDLRNGATNYDIYAQRVSAAGLVLWGTDGVPVCTATRNQRQHTIVPDGAGGAIVVWRDERGGAGVYDIYAQRISASGVVQWAPNGIPVCTAPGAQQEPMITSDGAGGAIVTWWDGGTGDVHVQRISAAGEVLWTSGGVPLSLDVAIDAYPRIAPDGSGGAIVAWENQGSGDIYAQRISAAGVVRWSPGGVLLCGAPGMQELPVVASDSAGGAIVAWRDRRGGDEGQYMDIYAQRVSGAGAVQWTPDGVAVCTAPYEQWGTALTSDGAGGAIVTWMDARSVTEGPDIYAQRVAADGAVRWSTNGEPVSTGVPVQLDPVIAADGSGGAIVTWQDGRGSLGYDVYAQRMSHAGAAVWTANGVALCTVTANYETFPAIAADGAGGAIVAWMDSRAGSSFDIYAQRVKGDGDLGGGVVGVPDASARILALDRIHPNPARGSSFTVEFSVPDAAPASLELFDIAGRRRAAREAGASGAGRHAIDLGRGVHLEPGVYLVRLTQGALVRTARVTLLR